LIAVIAINLARRETKGFSSYSTKYVLSGHTTVSEEEVPENIDTI